jgi:hypothetical protein
VWGKTGINLYPHTINKGYRINNMNEHIIIKDDKGKKHTFYNLKELIEYLDSFKMSFLPDNFSYEIKERE